MCACGCTQICVSVHVVCFVFNNSNNNAARTTEHYSVLQCREIQIVKLAQKQHGIVLTEKVFYVVGYLRIEWCTMNACVMVSNDT